MQSKYRTSLPIIEDRKAWICFRHPFWSELFAPEAILSSSNWVVADIQLIEEETIAESTVMSKATKRKHVTKEAVDNHYLLPNESQEVVKVICSRGNNLHEVETGLGVRYLVTMPTKFRKNVWVKRGGFVVVEPIVEGNKVKAEIVQILLKDQIKYIKKEGKWPSAFDDVLEVLEAKDDSGQSDHSDDLQANPNRPQAACCESSSETSSDESDSKT